MSVRLGLLSTARINEQILRGASETPAVEVVAVASRDAARAEEYARTHGVPRPHGSYEDLLADPGVDAVYVALPSALHVPWTLNALEAGKHVLCEKPFAARADDAERAFDLAEARALVLAEAFMYRHHPQSARIAELVREGAIGRLRSIHAHFSFRLTDPANIRMSAELGGGALLDLGTYCVSGARLLAGEPERVQAEQTLAESGVDVAFHATMRFPGDVVAQLEASFLTPLGQRLEAAGEEGTLAVEAPWRQDWGGDVLLRRGDEIERVEIPAANAYARELADFAAAIGGAAPLLGRADAVAQARALEALRRAADTGEPVAL
jgi:xylose dehydrogenase (NAD/NADP)